MISVWKLGRPVSKPGKALLFIHLFTVLFFPVGHELAQHIHSFEVKSVNVSGRREVCWSGGLEGVPVGTPVVLGSHELVSGGRPLQEPWFGGVSSPGPERRVLQRGLQAAGAAGLACPSLSWPGALPQDLAGVRVPHSKDVA